MDKKQSTVDIFGWLGSRDSCDIEEVLCRTKN